MRPLEIYIHIPFCIKKCLYCDFISGESTLEEKKRYIQALQKEIVTLSEEYKEYAVETVFIGGGTPSTLFPGAVASIMDCVRKNFSCVPHMEVTIETNPGTLSYEKLLEYKNAGINRLSMGLQSARCEELKLLGRIHTFEQFVENYKLAREIGFDNINVDLMYAIPGQTMDSFSYSLRQVVNLQPEHISVYSLILEEGTPFYENRERLSASLVEEDTEREMYHYAESFLQKYGYDRYEISNYARPGRECKHNIGYWIRKEYVGFGVSAASYVQGIRYSNVTGIEEYCELIAQDNVNLLKENMQVLSVKDAMEEMMFLGLRLKKGISAKAFQEQFGMDIYEEYGDALYRNEKDGLLKLGEQIYLTQKGTDLSNYCMARFLH